MAAGVRPDVGTFNTLIGACGNAGGLGKALGVCFRWKVAGVRPDVGTFNTLIGACGNAGDLGKALGVSDIIVAGVRPDVGTFNTLIGACGNAGDLGKALGGSDIIVAGVRPDVGTFNTLGLSVSGSAYPGGLLSGKLSVHVPPEPLYLSIHILSRLCSAYLRRAGIKCHSLFFGESFSV